MPNRQILHAIVIFIAVGRIPRLELPLGHASVGVGSGVLDRFLAHAVPAGASEVVFPPEERCVVLEIALQSRVE
jgi:hypothetical protein